MQNHRLVLIKPGLALDYLLGTEGGMCDVFKLKGDRCATLLPASNNMSTIIQNLETPKHSVNPPKMMGGGEVGSWLRGTFGDLGGQMISFLTPVSAVIVTPVAACLCSCCAVKLMCERCTKTALPEALMMVMLPREQTQTPPSVCVWPGEDPTTPGPTPLF